MRKKNGNVTLYDINGSSAFCLCGKTDDKKQGTKTAGTKKDESKEERTAKGESEKGMTAPDFEVTLLSGKTVKLSDYRGKGSF
ncbi:MAG: peroxiredoxin family protein [Sellimonas intestinalis]